jgi:hypothetical protein
MGDKALGEIMGTVSFRKHLRTLGLLVFACLVLPPAKRAEAPWDSAEMIEQEILSRHANRLKRYEAIHKEIESIRSILANLDGSAQLETRLNAKIKKKLDACNHDKELKAYADLIGSFRDSWINLYLERMNIDQYILSFTAVGPSASLGSWLYQDCLDQEDAKSRYNAAKCLLSESDHIQIHKIPLERRIAIFAKMRAQKFPGLQDEQGALIAPTQIQMGSALPPTPLNEMTYAKLRRKIALHYRCLPENPNIPYFVRTLPNTISREEQNQYAEMAKKHTLKLADRQQGAGTGYYVYDEKNSYLVSAKHVTDRPYAEGSSYRAIYAAPAGSRELASVFVDEDKALSLQDVQYDIVAAKLLERRQGFPIIKEGTLPKPNQVFLLAGHPVFSEEKFTVLACKYLRMDKELKRYVLDCPTWNQFIGGFSGGPMLDLEGRAWGVITNHRYLFDKNGNYARLPNGQAVYSNEVLISPIFLGKKQRLEIGLKDQRKKNRQPSSNSIDRKRQKTVFPHIA